MEKINTFVIPHLNYEGLERTVKSIRKHTPPNFNIILIDQNKEYQSNVDDLVDIHIYTKNVGFAKAMNMGIRLANTKYVSCWNDDCECINAKWWDETMEIFKRYSTALCVNPNSPRNPACSGCPPIDHPDFPGRDEWTNEEYDRLQKEVGKGYVIDGIAMFATVFDMEQLNKVKGAIPNKCWFDEYFHSGGEDYDMDRRAYLSEMRCLGGGGFVYHRWYSTKNEQGEEKVKYDGGLFDKKWGIWKDGTMIEKPDIYGKTGNKEIPKNTIKE